MTIVITINNSVGQIASRTVTVKEDGDDAIKAALLALLDSDEIPYLQAGDTITIREG